MKRAIMKPRGTREDLILVVAAAVAVALAIPSSFTHLNLKFAHSNVQLLHLRVIFLFVLSSIRGVEPRML
ncbi:hypothetical protein Pint_28724 [Pistacia integerrima]|uniref:Uncharacterized protein n=1 Tax=Pistacia integerrima TaxID=434235 RepID=A0ACC0YS10_9ROSI|nr:hypothetical protein Pint_28724 [Pistacia integerrima]